MSREPHVPDETTRAIVKAACAFGRTVEEIARYLKVGRMTMFKYYGEEIRIGSFEANLKVEKTGFEMATSKQHPAVTIFWLKTKCGYRETDRIELTGAGGSALSFRLSFEDGGPGQETPRRLARPVPQEIELSLVDE